jgi:hypothetical protein
MKKKYVDLADQYAKEYHRLGNITIIKDYIEELIKDKFF